jgi:cytochrome oxidase assembly protein ShyY1
MARLLFVLLSLSMIAVFIKLCLWQLARAEEKATLELSMQQQRLIDAVAFDWSELKPLHKVSVKGQWFSEPLLWDNRMNNGQVGYEWLGLLEWQEKWLIVNLGWVKAEQDRRILPPWQGYPEQVSGYLREVEVPILLGDWIEDGVVARIQYPSPQLLSEYYGLNVMPWVLETSPDWHPVQSMTSQKHRGYALQWGLMALATSILTIVWIRKT